jgi:hypothetical protein
MPRLKGAIAIKFLDSATQDDVAMRNILWRGGDREDDVYERRLRELYTAMARLAVQRRELRERKRPLQKAISTKRGNPYDIAKIELRDVESEITSVETKFRNIKTQIKQTLTERSRPRRKRPAFPWQEMAVRLIMEHKQWQAQFLTYPVSQAILPAYHGVPPQSRILTEGEFVLGTKGATISSKLLQQLLRAVGFSVGERQLRRFMRVCAITGQQGRRTDLKERNR